ncbi:uroporphyrinogen-III synthase [Denitromonas sp.]|uniref:uroporphyrinogen-III synthase n=1 Tax=Denitromonas sp. TaxID=2734609 RepID=UPI002AFDE307|nr:uroporphyrinogen-III synthase [Denitromonas sp.]
MTPSQGRPLAGRRVVVTRPQAQADGLCQAIAAAGGEALCIPVMAIEAVPVSAEFAALIDALDQFHLAFFVSPNAAEHGLAAVRARRDWPSTLAVATVGKGSERALHALGFERVIAPDTGFDSEAVLALPEFSAAAVAGKRIIIFRGNGGRDLLGDTLAQRGAAVSYAACYARRVPTEGAASLLAEADRTDALILTSSEGVSNLMTMLGAQMSQLARIPVFAPHPRICARATAAGFARVVETAPGDAGVVAGLASYFLGGCRNA